MDPLTSNFSYEEEFRYDKDDDNEEFIYDTSQNDLINDKQVEEDTLQLKSFSNNNVNENRSSNNDHQVGESDERVLIDIFNASANGDLDKLKELKPSFSQSNETNRRSGLTPLHVASSNGHLEVVKFLVDQSAAMIEIEDREGQTALLRASHKRSNLSILNYLLSIGSNVQHCDNDGWNALHNASANGSEDCVRCILKYADKSIIDSIGGLEHGPGYTALMNASSRGLIDIVRYLLTECEPPSNPFIRNKSGATAFSLAAESLNFDICELISDVEKSIIIRSKDYNTLNYHQSIPITIIENQRLDCRLSTLAKNGGIPKWSNSGLGSNGRRPKFEFKEDVNINSNDPFNDIKIPSIDKPFNLTTISTDGKQSSSKLAYFWSFDDWVIWKPLKVDEDQNEIDNDGWIYAHEFNAPKSEWKSKKSNEIKALESGVGVGSIKAAQMFGGRSGLSGSKAKTNENVDKNYWVRRRRWVRVLQRDPSECIILYYKSFH